MKWTPWLFGSLTALWIAGCGGNKRNNDTGAAAGAASDSSAMQSGATGTVTDTTGMSARTDTGMTGTMNSDTARTGSRMHTDTTAATGQPSSAGAKSKSKIRSGKDSVPGSNQ